MVALARDPKSDLFEGSNRIKVVDAGDARHLLRDLDFAYLGVFK